VGSLKVASGIPFSGSDAKGNKHLTLSDGVGIPFNFVYSPSETDLRERACEKPTTQPNSLEEPFVSLGLCTLCLSLHSQIILVALRIYYGQLSQFARLYCSIQVSKGWRWSSTPDSTLNRRRQSKGLHYASIVSVHVSLGDLRGSLYPKGPRASRPEGSAKARRGRCT